jgi:hypothetical protein
MALKVPLCSSNYVLPQHWSVLRAKLTLNNPKIIRICLFGRLLPIHTTRWCRARGLMWGARGPFMPATAMVSYGCVGCCWSLEAKVRSMPVGLIKVVYISNFFYSYVDAVGLLPNLETARHERSVLLWMNKIYC